MFKPGLLLSTERRGREIMCLNHLWPIFFDFGPFGPKPGLNTRSPSIVAKSVYFCRKEKPFFLSLPSFVPSFLPFFLPLFLFLLLLPGQGSRRWNRERKQEGRGRSGKKKRNIKRNNNKQNRRRRARQEEKKKRKKREQTEESKEDKKRK